MATRQTQAILFVALLALPLLPATLLAGSAQASGATPLETLRNGSFEGVPGAANGYELERDAETAAVAEHGLQSVNLARTSAAPTNNTLGAVVLYATHSVELRHVASLSYSYNVPREPPFVRLSEVIQLDLDGDGMEDACLVAAPTAALTVTTGWVRRNLDGATSFVVGDVHCPSGGAQRTLADLQADHAYREAKIVRVKLQTMTSIGPWPIAPVYVDRASLLATSSPLVRIRDANDNLCDGASFASVQAAVACAGTGATILVAPGTYTGTVTISKPVTLCATRLGGLDCEDGRTDVILRGDSPYVALVTSSDVTLRGLVLENPGYTGSDQTTGSRVDPTLVVVSGSRVNILHNLLRQAAAPPAVGQSRWSTFAVHVQGGDSVVLRDNWIRMMPASFNSESVCPNPPCRTIGIQIGADATNALVLNNTVDMAGARRVHGIASLGAGARIEGNHIRVPSEPGTASNAGIHLENVVGGEVARNLVLRADGGRPLYGIRGLDVDVPFYQNMVTGATIGMSLTAPAGKRLMLLENEVIDVTTGFSLGSSADLWANNLSRATDGFVLTGASAAEVLVRESIVRTVTTLLRTDATTRDSAIDAQQNDWGIYDLQDIQQRVAAGGANNVVDVTCYLERERSAVICPPTPAFAWAPETPSWNKTVTFLQTSTSGGRPIVASSWSFGDGNSSDLAEPTHAYARPGTYDVTLTVTDSDGTSVSLTRAIAVINRAPVFDPRGPYTVQENQTMTFSVNATDADGDSLAYAMVAGPAGATFDAANRTFSWRPDFTQAGLHTLRFTANDSFAVRSLDVEVNVTDVNAPPFLEPIGRRTIGEGEALRIDVRATDVDGQRIRLNAFVRPIGSTFRDHGNGTGTFTWTPGFQQSGNYSLTFEANDGLLETREVIVIEVLNRNRAPIFDPLPNQTVPEGALLQFLVSATDIDNDIITFAAPVLPAGATFNATARRFAWTPNLEQEGIHRVVFTATDGKNTTEAETFVHVAKTNRAPYIDPIPQRGVAFNRTILFTITGGDPDRDPVTYRMEKLPPGANFDPATRVFSWRPLESDVGRHELEFIVDDGNATGVGIGILTVIVNQAPVVTLELPPTLDAGIEATFRATAHDPDTNGAVRIEWDFDERDGFSAQSAGGFVKWTYAAAGEYNVTIRAIDRDGVVNVTRATIHVDDTLHLWIDILDSQPNVATTTLARVTVRLSNGTGVANALVNLTAAYQPHAAGPRQFERPMQVVTGADGTAMFFIPRDGPFVNVPGRHVVDGHTVVQDSLNGDAEAASASTSYHVSPPL